MCLIGNTNGNANEVEERDSIMYQSSNSYNSNSSSSGNNKSNKSNNNKSPSNSSSSSSAHRNTTAATKLQQQVSPAIVDDHEDLTITSISLVESAEFLYDRMDEDGEAGAGAGRMSV